PGVGPWTAEMIAMRGLGDPDAFPVDDLGLRRAAQQLGMRGSVRALTDHSIRWRPWRSYVTQHLWTALRNCQYLWIGVFQATSVPVCCSPSDGGLGGVISVGRSSSLPLWKTAPARTRATR